MKALQRLHAWAERADTLLGAGDGLRVGEMICCAAAELSRWRLRPAHLPAPTQSQPLPQPLPHYEARWVMRLADASERPALAVALSVNGFDLDQLALAPPATDDSGNLLRKFRDSLFGAAALAELQELTIEAAEWLDAQSAEPGEPDSETNLYETYVEASRPSKRKSHGIYYTPPAICDFIVAQAQVKLLELGFAEGLLDTRTWSQWARETGGDIPASCLPHRPAVQILDPAAGGGAFLAAVVRLCHDQWMRRPTHDKNQSGANTDGWTAELDRLLPRLAANEVIPTASLIGRMRLLRQLLELGYRPHDATRLEWTTVDTLAQEQEPRTAHRGPPTVILGNPPYRSVAEMSGAWGEQLIRGRGVGPAGVSYFDVNGEPLGERKVWLNDSYVRFLRWAQWRIDVAGWGVVSLVLNHGLLDNVTFRGARQKLCDSFTEIDIVDMHGSKKARERAPDGAADENVFGISTGVAVVTLQKQHLRCGLRARRRDLWGVASAKLNTLRDWTAELLASEAPALAGGQVDCEPPEYLFRRDPRPHAPEYLEAPRLPELMPLYSTAPVTARDRFVVDRSREALLERMRQFGDLSIPDDVIRARYFQRGRSAKYPPGDTRGWRLQQARQRMAEWIRSEADWTRHIHRCLYRPFDWRHVFWSEWMIDWPRPELTRHFTEADSANVAIIARRQMLPSRPCDYFWATSVIALDGVIRSDNRGSESLFPLWRFEQDGRRANFDEHWAAAYAKRAGLRWSADLEVGDLIDTLGPLDLFHYLYGMFFHPEYRIRYAEHLRRDFPRVPFAPRETFQAIAESGRRLLEIHCQTKPAPAAPLLDASTAPSCDSVPEEVWAFHVGGHQVAPKWLRSQTAGASDEANVAELRREFSVLAGQIQATLEAQRQLGKIALP
ncbi:MAG: hypothetical protein KDB14_29875 [Planctomycetales bacterium]|nr:hypothetical protein [Planctomycetales bacterium]